MCVSNPVSKGPILAIPTTLAKPLVQHTRRGVRHSYPITRNEAVDKSGKGNLASFLYLHQLFNIF